MNDELLILVIGIGLPGGLIATGIFFWRRRWRLLACLFCGLGALIVLGLFAPSFLPAKANAQKNSCIANLKQIEGVVEQWALQNNKTRQTKIEMDAIKLLFKSEKLPECPSGGTYSIGTVEETPRCSLAGKGHQIE